LFLFDSCRFEEYSFFVVIQSSPAENLFSSSSRCSAGKVTMLFSLMKIAFVSADTVFYIVASEQQADLQYLANSVHRPITLQ